MTRQNEQNVKLAKLVDRMADLTQEADRDLTVEVQETMGTKFEGLHGSGWTWIYFRSFSTQQ